MSFDLNVRTPTEPEFSPGLELDPAWSCVHDKVHVGKAFAFCEADLLSATGAAWLPAILGVAATNPPRLVSLLGWNPVLLPGAIHPGTAPPRLELAIVVSDQSLYAVGEDVVRLLVLDPGRPGVEIELDVACNGALRLSQRVLLNTHGAASVVLRDLPAGAYALRFQGESEPCCKFQVVSDPSKTATLPLLGESSLTVFSALGTEFLGSLLATEQGPVRGFYLRRGAAQNTPLVLERVDTNRGVLTARSHVGPGQLVVLDPTYREARSAQLLEHPARKNQQYQAGAILFRRKKYQAAREEFCEARRKLADPHPYFAYNIACCLSHEGRTDEAIGWLEQSLREGWWEFPQLASDPDLTPLRKHPRFARLLSRGRTVVEFGQLNPGETLEFDVPGPMGLLTIGAFLGDMPWEGWAALLPPPELRPELLIPTGGKPGQTVEIRIEGAGSGLVYLRVKDASLLSTDSPARRLSGSLKACLEAASQELVNAPVGRKLSHFRATTTSTEGLLGASAETLIDSTIDPFVSAPLEVGQAGEVDFCGLLTVVDGVARQKIVLAEHCAELAVEAFVLQHMDWLQLDGRLLVSVDPWLAFDVPPYLDAGDSASGRIRARTLWGNLEVCVLRDGVPIVQASASGEFEQTFQVIPGCYEARVVHRESGEDVRRTVIVQAAGS